MSGSKTSGDGVNQSSKRNLPSWMSSRENEEGNKGKGHGEGEKESGASTPGLGFSKLLASQFTGLDVDYLEGEMSELIEKRDERFRDKEGVVFVLSGFINPERGVLRSQALEMGAEFKPDWNPQCTLLVCAFPNTPKFRQVESDCGTIVSKEWITECYTQKKLVDIEKYMMHAGKPWRRSKIPNESSQDQKTHVSGKSYTQADKGLPSEPSTSASTKNKDSNPAKEHFSPSKLKKWAIDDLKDTVSWLESQEEKPEGSEIKKIAAEGILTCLQDAIDSLEQNQDVCQVTEQWSFVPRVVEELAKLDKPGKDSAIVPKDDLCRQAKACKQIYEAELSSAGEKKQKTAESHHSKNGKTKVRSGGGSGYDSDATIEMTEEEIEVAYKTISSELCKQ